MPTYEYVCRACGHIFEQFQSITADPVRTCPKCGKRKVERKIGIGAGVLFRGGGFYETDYRSESYSTAEKAERESRTKSDGSSGDAKGSGGAAADAKATGTKAAGAQAAGGETKAAGDAKGAKSGSAPEKGSSGGSAPSNPESGAKTDGASKPRKSHAREGRGIGNILALGRGAGGAGARKAGAGAKTPSSRSASAKPRGKRR